MNEKIDILAPYVRYASILKYLQGDSKDALIRECVKYGGEYDAMRLGDYLHVLNGDYSCIGLNDEIKVWQYYWIVGLKEHVENFVKALKQMTIPETAAESKAGAGLLPLSLEESVLIFCKDFFGLNNFDINGLKVWEFMLAKKAAYNKGLFQRNYDKIMSQKMKPK